MKTLKHYLPEGFASQMSPTVKSDNMGPISGAQAYRQPNPAETVNGHRELNIGDPVIIVGNVQHAGEKGIVDDFGQDKHFVVVNLSHGKSSFHSSDVEFNDHDDDDDDDDSAERDLYNLRKMSGIE